MPNKKIVALLPGSRKQEIERIFPAMIGAARMLQGEVSARMVPFAAVGISVFCWDFAVAVAAAGETIPDAWAVLSAAPGWRMMASLFLLAMCGGAFSVPLYAIIQQQAAVTERSRMVAANNVMNALFMVCGSAAAAGMAAMGMDAPAVLLIAAGANGIVAVISALIVPPAFLRRLLRG